MLQLQSPPGRAYRVAAAPVWLLRDDDARSPRRDALAWRAAVHADVVRPLVADRAEAYLTILAVLRRARDEGSSSATLDDLRRRMRVADDDEPAFLRDLLQLEAWGCLTRELEPARVRGYSDARRDRYRHRIEDDAADFLAWLDARREARDAREQCDAGERFVDLAGRLAELTQLVRARVEPDEPPAQAARRSDSARRASHLVRVVDEELEGIDRSLARLDAELHAFADRGFEPEALERIVAGLERFLRDHVVPLESGRTALEGGLEALDAAGFGARWASWRDEERATLASLLRPTTATPESGSDVLARWSGALRRGGSLDHRARRVEQSTQRVIATLRAHVHVAAAGVRSPRHVHDVALRLLVERADEDVRVTLWGRRTPIWAPGVGEPLLPPLPRRRTRAASSEPAPLEAKPLGTRVETRPTRESRRREALAWLADARATEAGCLLSELDRDARRAPEAARAWITLAHARHLSRGRSLRGLGVWIERRAGVVTLGDDTRGLVAEDCVVAPMPASAAWTGASR